MKKIIYSIGVCLVATQVSAQVVSSTTLFVGEGAVVSFGMNVENSGEFTNKGKVHFQKNIENNGSLSSEGIVVFDGNSQQAVKGNKTLSLSRLELENDLNLETSVLVSNQLNFGRGVIQTTNNNALVFSENATHSGASDYSHIAGNVVKQNAQSFEFPVGDGTNYRAFDVKEADGKTLSAQYLAKSPLNISGEMAQGVEQMNENEYWALRSESNNANLKVALNPASGLDQVTYLNRGTWEVSKDNRLSDLRDGVLFTSGRGRNIQKEIGVWPNPTRGEFNLKLSGMNDNDAISVDITNQDGRTVMHLTGSVKQLRRTYELPQNLTTTELTVRVINKDEALTQKLVLNR